MSNLSNTGQLDGKLAIVTGVVVVSERRAHAYLLKRAQLWWSLAVAENKLLPWLQT